MLQPKAKKVLARLRLLQMNNAIFMKADTATAELLKTVDPYVSFGYPSREQVEVHHRNLRSLVCTDHLIHRS